MSDASWSFGWTFYKTGQAVKPPADIDPVELKRFLHGIDGDGDLLEDCFKTAELTINELAFSRWPLAPVHGYAD